MKQYIYFILTIGVLFLNSCMDETIVKNKESVKAGIPVTAQIGFQAENPVEMVVTKGSLSPATEFKVHNLYVFVFEKSGSDYVYETSQLFSGNDLNVTSEKGNSGTVTTGTVSFDMTSGEKKILAIANASDQNAYQISQSLGEIQSVDDLSSLVATLSLDEAASPLYRGSGRLLMSGSFSSDQTSSNNSKVSGGVVSINESGRPTTSGKICLERLDGKITFNVKTGSNINFTPTGYRVVNVPIVSYLFERDFSAEEGSEHDACGDAESALFYKDSKAENNYDNFDEITPDDNSVNRYLGGNFTFYMFENRKRALNNITDYAERERQKKGATGLNGDYVNAHKFATYVEIVGSFYEQYEENGAKKEKTAEVKYTIHLGYEGNDASNFQSKRNCDYTYNVTINGVDNIEVEVETSNDDEEGIEENQPGAEGDVVKSDQFFYVDAHYATKLITFNRGKISGSASFRVKTPYDPDGRGNSATDYLWAWFVQNDREQVTTGYETWNFYSDKGKYDKRRGRIYKASEVESLEEYTFESVKGYRSQTAINSGWYGNGSYYKVSQIRIPVTSASIEYNKKFISFPEQTSKRLNIKQLIAILKHEAFKGTDVADTYPLPDGVSEGVQYTSPLFDSDGNALFTLFIDEYYYDDKKWWTFANKDNREMHILCDTEYSADKESSLTSSSFLISQKSIKTFYRTDGKAETAWGLENETEKVHSLGKNDGRLPINGNSEISYRSKVNGRYNMYMNIGWSSGSTAWDTYVNSADNMLKNTGGSGAKSMLQYACLQRNRDLNGNGTIENFEVRWYMPAINQMTGMFLGKDALPADVHLVLNGTKVTRNEKDDYSDNYNYRDFHYTNSNNIQFWAEEGAATGSNGMNNGYWNYRCVRNLGVSYPLNSPAPAETEEFEDYVKIEDGENKGNVILNLSNVNEDALRSGSDNGGDELAFVNELSEYNRPYSKFEIRSTLTSETIAKGDIYAANQNKSPCPKGWRMPNMRELSLILAYGGFDNSVMFSNTQSSLSYKIEKQNVYHINASGILTLADTGSGKVRCVRDVK